MLAASPRRYVRLLGLNASRWPRRFTEDRLIPHQVIDKKILYPISVTDSDRQHF